MNAPQPAPDQFWATRIQQELASLFWPTWSQWNWTLMRPYSSVQISLPEGPTTIAVWEPAIRGRGVPRAGRKATAAGMASKSLLYSRRPARWRTDSRMYFWLSAPLGWLDRVK